VAVVRHSGVITYYVNGIADASTATAAGTLIARANPSIGDKAASGPNYSNAGYYDEIRVTKGVARYTANFTPATSAFPDF